MRRAVAVSVVLLGAVTMPGQIHAQGQNPVVQEVRQTIQAGYDYSAENLKDQPNGYSA